MRNAPLSAHDGAREKALDPPISFTFFRRQPLFAMTRQDEQQIPAIPPLLRFPLPLEREYLQHFEETRLITSPRLILTGLAVFCSFVVLDYIAFPIQAAVQAWLIRGATMLLVLATLAFTLFRSGRIRFATVLALALVINAAVVAIDVIGSKAAGYTLVPGSLFVMVASFTLVRFPFWIAVVLILCMFATQLVALLLYMDLGANGILNNVLFYFLIMAMLLISNHSMDTDSRRIFLLTFYRKKYEKSGLDRASVKSIAARFTHYMQQEKAYLNAELTIEDAARVLQVRRHHLTQAINEASGTTFLACVNEYRVKEAQRLLEESGPDMTILRIAFDTGFNSKATFNRIFRKATGLSPSDYRKRRELVSGPGKKGTHPGG